MDIKGHAAVVTGGASGLGAATAEELARAGAKVACLDVNLDGARAVAERIGGCAVRCDVTDGEQAAAALAQARDQHGPARILINCAGIGPAKRIVGRDGPMPLADFERVIAINLIGTFNMMRLAAADMQNLSPLADEERGVIISAASVAAFEGQIGQAAYSASKGGVAALTMPAAREFAQFGIRVNAIAPGIFHTPMLMALAGGGEEKSRRRGAVPQAIGPPRSVRVARASHHREHVYQRRGHPPRRRAADGAALNRPQGPREMLVNSRAVRIEWGDCDPAGIVYYPRYFAFFDASTSALLERALGMTKHHYLKAYDFSGHPLVNARSRFLIPTRFGDDVTIETTATDLRRSSFDVHHRLLKNGALAVEGFETRVWVKGDPAKGTMKGAPIPQAVIERLSQR